MRIEAYFQQIREAIETCSVVQAFSVTYDKRGTYEGFIRGEVYFVLFHLLTHYQSITKEGKLIPEYHLPG